MTKTEAMQLFQNSGALLKGHFLLSSGLHSDEYIQCARIMENPHTAEAACRGLADVVRQQNWPQADIVVGPALGAVTVAYELARQLGAKAYFAERADSRFELRRGFTLSPGQKVIVAENITTTAGSAQEVVELIQQLGGDPVGVAVLADRTNGKSVLTVPLCSLIQLSTQEFPAADCPLCRQNLPLDKPGSRKFAAPPGA